jgi:hypothetical protein
MLSLVMLIDRIGTMQEKNILKELPPDYLERIALKIPENLNKLLSDVVTTLPDRFGNFVCTFRPLGTNKAEAQEVLPV